MAKKSKVDVGKGFKRIYFVIAGLWIALLTYLFFKRTIDCLSGREEYFFCSDYNFLSELVGFIIYTGIVVPIYFFIKWIAAGFKKK